jgi:5'-phosphate synthase pdxT subunit
MTVKIGILALQGAFVEHQAALWRLVEEDGIAVDAVQVRKAEELVDLDGLIIPGGESTTMTLSAERLGLWSEIKQRLQTHQLPCWGTCAGAIMLCRRIDNQMRGGQDSLAVLDVAIRRNAFGSQVNSFISPLILEADGQLFPHGIFIRAPMIEDFDDARCRVLARLAIPPANGMDPNAREKSRVCALSHDNILLTTFHPELTDNLYFHRRFLQMILDHRP